MRQRGARALGPYPEPNGRWRVIVIREDRVRESQILSTRAEAIAVVEGARVTAEAIGRTVSGAITEYERHLIAKGNKPRSYRETLRRLRVFFADQSVLLEDLTPTRCRTYYEQIAARMAVDSHRNYLAEAKSFLRWCATDKRWLRRNPLEQIKGKGMRRHGKPQLHIDEARRWQEVALKQLAQGEAGALAALMTLYMDFRAGEIVALRVRDIDDEARVVWVERGKTLRARRTLEVPEEPGTFRAALLRLTKGRDGAELLFRAERGKSGGHWRDWPREWVQRICTKAGVPVVTAHGMRGLHATLATEMGATGHLVALAMGHESSTTTYQSYASPDAVARAKARGAMKLLQGGKGKKARNGVKRDRSEPESEKGQGGKP